MVLLEEVVRSMEESSPSAGLPEQPGPLADQYQRGNKAELVAAFVTRFPQD